MMLIVSDKIKSKTTKCAFAFSCLSTGLCGNPTKCKVLNDFDKNMLVVHPQEPNDISCPYHMTYSRGGEHVCTCPTHYASFTKTKRLASYNR